MINYEKPVLMRTNTHREKIEQDIENFKDWIKILQDGWKKETDKKIKLLKSTFHFREVLDKKGKNNWTEVDLEILKKEEKDLKICEKNIVGMNMNIPIFEYHLKLLKDFSKILNFHDLLPAGN